MRRRPLSLPRMQWGDGSLKFQKAHTTAHHNHHWWRPCTPAPRQVTLALLKFARAAYLTPHGMPPAHSSSWLRHINNYLRSCVAVALPWAPDTSRLPAADAVAVNIMIADMQGTGLVWPDGGLWQLLLGLANAFERMLTEPELGRVVPAWVGLLKQLSDQRRAAGYSRQLAEVSRLEPELPQPLLTVEQLAYFCHRQLVVAAAESLRRGKQRPASAPPSVVPLPSPAALAHHAADSKARMLQLQPDGIRSHLEAVAIAEDEMELPPRQASNLAKLHQAAQHARRGLALARQQRSALGIMGAARLLLHAAAWQSDVARTREGIAVLQEGGAAMRRAQRLLPGDWTREALHQLDPAVRWWTTAADGMERKALGLPIGDMRLQLDACIVTEGPPSQECAGCGRYALSLRRCSRCKAVWYCRCGQGQGREGTAVIAPDALQGVPAHLPPGRPLTLLGRASSKRGQGEAISTVRWCDVELPSWEGLFRPAFAGAWAGPDGLSVCAGSVMAMNHCRHACSRACSRRACTTHPG